MRDIRCRRDIAPDTPVLISEPVEFLAEYRCFMVEGKVVASSPYLSYGKPVWKQWGKGGEMVVPSQHVLALCLRLAKSCALPPAFVVDVGFIEDRGCAVVEFNPAWSSGMLGADPHQVLTVLQRACRHVDTLAAEDARWVVER